MMALSKTQDMEDGGGKGTGAGQRGGAMPKAAQSPSNYASGDEDGRELGYVSSGSSNWYGKLKGMSSSLKKLTLSKKKQPSATQGSQSLARAISFNNTSKSVDHGRPSSSSKKELAATNLKGLGSNSVDLSCGIARVPSGGVVPVPKRRNRSLELPREHLARAEDAAPAFSKSKIPIVKSNFVKESKEKTEDSDDPTFGIHLYQRLATASDSDGDDTGGTLRPASTTVEYESSLANLMLMEQLGCDPPLPADSSPQKDEQNAKSTKPGAGGKRLDVIISAPAKEIPAAGGKKEAVAGSAQKPAKEEKSGGSGWPLRRLTGSGPLLSNGRKKVAANEKKATEIANTGIKGKGPGKSMSGELFTLKAAKKAAADPVVPARKSVSDIPARKSASKDGPNPSTKKPQPDASAGKRTGSGILPDAARKQPVATVTKKAGPVSDSPGPGRKSADLGLRNAGPGRKSVSNKLNLGSSALNGQGEVIRPAGDSVSGQPDKGKIVGSNEDPGSMLEFLKASVDFSAPYVQGAVVSEREKVDSSAGLLHPDSLFDASGSPTSILAGSGGGESLIAAYGESVEQEEGVRAGGDEDDGSGRSPPSGSEIRIVGISREFDGQGGGGLEPTAFKTESPKKSVQDLIRELERNAAQAARAGPARAQKGVTVPIKERAGVAISSEAPPPDGEDGAGSGQDGEAGSSSLEVEEKRAVSDSEQGPSVASPLAGDLGGDLNSVSMARFESASVTAETPNDALKAELTERFEELHHKLKIDLDPRVVQDIHRTFNFGLVQAAAVASAGESGTSRGKPAQGITADGNRRKKLVAPPKALGAAAYSNKIIEGIAGLSVSIAKPAAAAQELAIGEVASSAADKSSSSANPYREALPAPEDSEEEEIPYPAIDPAPLQPLEQPRSSVESTMDVRVLSSTASTKMLTSRNMDKVAALLMERGDRRAAPRPDPADEASSEADSARFQDLPRSSIESEVKALSSTSSNKMLTAKNFQRVTALLNEYNAELKAGLVVQPRTAGGLDSSSSSFSRLDPMLNLDEFESEADHTVTKKVVKPYLIDGSSSKSSPARVASDTYQTSTPPSAKSNGTAASGGSAARRNGPRAVASRYRNVDYSPKVSKLGQSVDAADMRGPWNRGSGSQTARRSLDLQFKAQMSDPYYSKPRNSRSGAAHHSNSNGNGGWSSSQADRGQPKRGRARSPGANSLSRDSGQGGRKAGPAREDSNLMALQAHVQSEAANGKQKSRMVAAAMEERLMHEDVKVQKDRFQEKHQLSRPEYIDECNDIIPVWVDGGSVEHKPEAAPRAAAPRAAATSSAATRLRNSGLRPRENLSYNGEALRVAARPKDRRNFSGPLVAGRLESGLGLSDEELQESEGEKQWPRSGPVIPASVLRQIYDDREISEDHELVVDRSSFSGVLRDRGPRDSPNGAGGLYFSGPLISETIRKSKIVHSGPPSTGSDPFFDRVSKGKMSRSASIRMRETENPDSGDIPDQVMHEHEYLIQDHEQLYEYLDEYSDQNTFLDQYIADQLQELALQQDLHDILSDQLEKAQAAAAARAATSASGPSDMSFDSKSGHELDMDSQEGEAAREPERELEVDDGEPLQRRTFDSDGGDESPILDQFRGASPDQILRSPDPEEKPISASPEMITQEPDAEEDDQGNFPDAFKQMEQEYEPLPAAAQQVSGDKQRSPSSVPLSRASLLEAVENDLNGSPGRGGAASSSWYKLRSPSSKSMGASSLPDTHQDLDMRVGSSQRSTVSSRAKSKLYSSSDSPGGGYDSDRNGAEPSGIRSRFRSNRDFMNSSVQSEPGGMRALLAKSRGMISANSSPAPGGMSSRRRAARTEAGTGGEISTPSRSAPRSRRSPSPGPVPVPVPVPATPPPSAAPAENSPVPSSINRTSFPSLYLMQVSQPAPPLTPTGAASANRRLRPPSRNLLTQNISTISIDDFKSGSRPAGASASALKQPNPRAQAPGNGGPPRPPSPGPGIQQAKPDLLNTSIQSDPGSKAATLLLNLEAQNRLGRGLSKSLSPDQNSQPGAQPAAIPAQPAPESDRIVAGSSNKQEGGGTRDPHPDPAAEEESESEESEELEEGSGSESGSESDSDCALSVGLFRREALRMFGAGAYRTDSEQEQELLSNLEFETRSLKLESEKGEEGDEISKDLQDMVSAKRGELEKLCAAVPDYPGPDSDFHSAVVDMILEKDDINDLLDLEEFLNGYMCLRPPFQDVVKQFFGDLCQCDLVY